MKDIRLIFTAVLIILLLTIPAEADSRWEIDLESGVVSSGYNDVQIPKETGTLFSLSEDLSIDPKAFFRARLTYKLADRHSLSVLYAPLELEAVGTLPKDVNFEGVLFPQDTEVAGIYRFNSPRLTYRYTILAGDDISLGIGFTALIRDAEITIESDTLKSTKTNVGFVPLLHLYLNWDIAERVGLRFEADALAAPQGRAEDVFLALFYRVNDNIKIKAGYRLLEGGADVDEVYNFAWLDYLVGGIMINF